MAFYRLIARSALSLAAAFLASQALAAPAGGFADVDPFIGTGPDGHTFPGAVVPFGMVQPSPDTLIADFKHSYTHAAGYRFGDPTIQGFSQTHFSGTGHSDLGDFELMPIAGEVKLDPGDPADKPSSGYRSRYSHDSERAEPGYYAVTLSDYGVRAELTATTRVALHRYAFPAGKPAHVLIDLRQSIYNYPGKVLWSTLRLRDDGTDHWHARDAGLGAGAYSSTSPCASPRRPPAISSTTAKTTPIRYNPFHGPGTGPGGHAGDLRARADRRVRLRRAGQTADGEDRHLAGERGRARSETSTPRRRALISTAVRAAAKAAWEQALGSVQFDVEPALRKTLYTSLYHALQAPSVSQDVDGQYRGPDGEVHTAKGFTFVSTFSLWDTFRAEQPLMTLIQPYQRTADVVNSLVSSREESPFGILPVWQYQGQETWCMIGYHAVPEIADAIVKGIPGFDRDRAIAAMTASATYAPYGHLGDYMKLGYLPTDVDGEGVSKTVEYAFDDWTIAAAAKSLGRADLAKTFEKRARNWRAVFNPKTGFVQPKLSDGSWREPFRPGAWRATSPASLRAIQLAIHRVRTPGHRRADRRHGRGQGADRQA